MNLSQRLLLWIAVSLILVVWAFPEVATTYYAWIPRGGLDAEGAWSSFHSISSHKPILSSENGLITVAYPFADESLLQLAKGGTRFSCYGGCEKRTRIVWQSSLLYSLLIMLIAGGGVWAFRSSEAQR